MTPQLWGSRTARPPTEPCPHRGSRLDVMNDNAIPWGEKLRHGSCRGFRGQEETTLLRVAAHSAADDLAVPSISLTVAVATCPDTSRLASLNRIRPAPSGVGTGIAPVGRASPLPGRGAVQERWMPRASVAAPPWLRALIQRASAPAPEAVHTRAQLVLPPPRGSYAGPRCSRARGLGAGGGGETGSLTSSGSAVTGAWACAAAGTAARGAEGSMRIGAAGASPPVEAISAEMMTASMRDWTAVGSDSASRSTGRDAESTVGQPIPIGFQAHGRDLLMDHVHQLSNVL